MTDVNLASKRLMSQGVISKSDYMMNQNLLPSKTKAKTFHHQGESHRGMTCARDVKAWRDSGLDSCR